jgi:hypothetical protein
MKKFTTSYAEVVPIKVHNPIVFMQICKLLDKVFTQNKFKES